MYMQDLGGHLIIGKYYQLETHDKAQYIGKTDDGQCFLFEWTNLSKTKIVLKRTFDMLTGQNPQISLYNDDDDETDTEFQDDPYS